MTKDEALKLALEALELCTNAGMIPMYLKANEKAITAIKEALAQPEQEPVAEIVSDTFGCLSTKWRDEWTPNEGDKLYTTPPQRKPLTDDEIWKNDNIMAANSGYGADFETLRQVIRAIEAAHGIKE
jgi:hypothetical protein